MAHLGRPVGFCIPKAGVGGMEPAQSLGLVQGKQSIAEPWDQDTGLVALLAVPSSEMMELGMVMPGRGSKEGSSAPPHATAKDPAAPFPSQLLAREEGHPSSRDESSPQPSSLGCLHSNPACSPHDTRHNGQQASTFLSRPRGAHHPSL